MRRIAAALAIFLAAGPVAAQPPASASTASPWRQMLEGDLAFVRKTLERRYIYAVYPGGADWEALYGPASLRAGEAVAGVTDFAGYRAVLTRFVGEFHDPHLRVNLNMMPAHAEWPGFTARYATGRVLVGYSDLPTILEGAQIESCDGRPVLDLLDGLEPLEGLVAGTESSRALAAAHLLVDFKNPFFERPQSCRIGGAEVTLSWSSIRTEQLLARTPPPLVRGVPTGLSDFGRNGAWIRLPLMSPRDAADAAAYRRLIEQAPGLRSKEVIVFDVRGNGGGPYNWFMAILRALYGEDYTSYYARERLRIRPVFVAGTLNTPPAVGHAPLPDAMPPDPDLDATVSAIRQMKLSSGQEVTVMEPGDLHARGRRTGPPPADPVHSQVYVLTDYGCASACIAFVDEMLQFPSVRQIGLETFVDMRSGSPASYALPSGNGVLTAPVMLREYRARGDNVQLRPSERFDGDIGDTEAVRRWILDTLLPADRMHRRASS
jgi:hypothetical protein